VGPLEQVTAPPYDTISPAEQRRFLDASPHNVIRLDLGEDRPGDDEVENKYRRAAAELGRWRSEGAVLPTPRPSYFPYEMRFAFQGERRRVRGLVCLVELEDWGGSIVPHERTMPGPVEDRLRLIRAIRANLSCIHALFFGPFRPMADLLEEAAGGQPVARLVDEEGVEHRMWITEEDRGLAEWLTDRSLLIADGHHRYTMALRYRGEMRALHGPGPWDRVMMLVVDAATENPPVLPIHRVLRSGSVPRGGARVRDLAEILAEANDDRLAYGVVARENGVLEHRVAQLAGEPPTVCSLHEQVLDEIGGDLRFTPDAVEAEEAVRSGDASAAFVLPPTTADRIRSVIDRGQRLPQKSTYFWPKPRTGMVLRPLE